MLAMLTFLTPWWAAAGLAAVGLPLLAHLLSRTRHRPVLFPAMRFVQRAAQETSRIEQPRHRLLMLLRWLLLLLVVLAFMQPRWQPEASAGHDPRRGVTAIILLDASASMQRAADGATLFDRARRLAGEQLNELDPARDNAVVLRVGRTARPLLPEPTAKLDLLRGRLDETECGYEAADWTGALAECVHIAESSGRAVRVIVISDQQGDWPSAAVTDYAGLLGQVLHARIEGPTANTSVRLVDLRPYPPVAGRVIDVTAEVRHFGAEARRFTLAATLGGERRQQQVTLEPGAVHRVDLRLTADQAGPAVLRLAIDGGDSMPMDDTDGALIDVLDRSSVLIVRGASSGDRALADRLAMVISPAASALNTPHVSQATIDQAAGTIAASDPSRLRTVLLLPGARADAAFADALDAYLERGGGVVCLCDPAAQNDQGEAARHLPFMRAPGEAPTRPPSPSRAVNLNFDHDALRIFEGPARAGLASLVWPGVQALALAEHAEPLLNTADGRPIVASLGVGRGRVLGVNARLSSDSGGLLAEPAFVVLFNELCRYASPGVAPPRATHPGRPVPATLMNTAALDRPEGADPSSGRFDLPGLYLAVDAAQRPVDGVWVSIEPAESDPRTGGGWADRGPGAGSADADSTASTGDPLKLRPNTIELWPYVALGALLLAAAESGLLWRFASGGAA